MSKKLLPENNQSIVSIEFIADAPLKVQALIPSKEVLQDKVPLALFGAVSLVHCPCNYLRIHPLSLPWAWAII